MCLAYVHVVDLIESSKGRMCFTKDEVEVLAKEKLVRVPNPRRWCRLTRQSEAAPTLLPLKVRLLFSYDLMLSSWNYSAVIRCTEYAPFN